MARLSLVVMKQQEVHGRVVLVSDDGENDTESAVLPVELYEFAGTNRILRVKTDAEGRFTFCGMSNGVYRMMCGRLTMRLEVVDSLSDATNRVAVAPNSLLVFLSRSLIEREE